jgi:hypothetical protein
MTNSYNFLNKLVENDTIDVSFMTLDDINFSYSIQTIIFLGGYDDLTEIEINDINVKLHGGFVYNQTPISKINVISSTYGVLIIGKKTKKDIFRPFINDTSFNNFVQSDYVNNYFN